MADKTSILPGPEGQLEAIVQIQSQTGPSAIICHPHPLYGGTMHNKVVYTLARLYESHGFNTVRFNFRGVGKSSGQYDEGRGEREDLCAVAAWLQTQSSGVIHLAGFSFGAYVAASEAANLQASSLVSVAPPVERLYFGEITPPEAPWIVVQPMADEVVSPEAVLAWFADLQHAQKYLIQIPEASHFFHGKLIELRDALEAKLQHLGIFV
ncbi:MAG: alpha/beta hydrolase [Gammaproteobacteria bacterium]|nr:MAG: alpha/beta hydrolase [Gammaproteobacteria bacterium]